MALGCLCLCMLVYRPGMKGTYTLPCTCTHIHDLYRPSKVFFLACTRMDRWMDLRKLAWLSTTSWFQLFIYTRTNIMCAHTNLYYIDLSTYRSFYIAFQYFYVNSNWLPVRDSDHILSYMLCVFMQLWITMYLWRRSIYDTINKLNPFAVYTLI